MLIAAFNLKSIICRNIIDNKLISRYLANMSKKSGGKVAVCQMTAKGDKCKNLDVVTDLVEKASKDGVKMLFFPEGCDYISETKANIVTDAEPIIGGFVVDKYREIASRFDVWLSMGGLHEKNMDNPSKIYNTHIIIDNKGDIVQTYRKIHMFDVEIPERNIVLKESSWSDAGRDIVTPVATPFGNIGMSICYDLRFPELSTQLALMGAEILTYPSAFTDSTGKAHWEVLLRARAIENQCYVIAAAQIGAHNARRVTHGHAIIVDPWGKVIANCGDATEPTYAIADIDLNKLHEIRCNMPVLNHRRNDVYSLYALSLRKKLPKEHKTAADCQPLTVEETVDDGESCVEACYTFGQATVPKSCVFYETELTYAFVNLRCVVPGHVLVAPKRLMPRLEDAKSDEAQDFFATVVFVEKLMERVHGTKSSTVTIQDGPDAGQTVKHLHCHIMPRKRGDFKDNDLIYLELARHDRVSADSPRKPPRTLKEMRAEAETLRREVEKVLNGC